ncbi:MAG: polysulfide reductase NrfD, partial [Clostridia bacterium]|nr:polysulfide reductase NrfD [Clostridia bacterium]
GAFTTAAVVYIFNRKKFAPLLRPAILTGFLGYILVALGLVFDLGKYYYIWHAIIYWQPRSVMFEVAWCVMLYLTVLALEFSPVVFEKFRNARAQRIIHSITIPLVCAGIILSTLHQSSLGSLFLIVPSKLHPLWWTPLLPVMFFVSAVAVGIGMVIVESSLSTRSFGLKSEAPILADFAKALPVILGIYFVLKIGDLAYRGYLGSLFESSVESNMLLLELLIGVLAPGIMAAIPSLRQNKKTLVSIGALVVSGVIINRFNVALVGMAAATGQSYFPSWMEISITAMLVAGGVLVYTFVAENFPLFVSHAEPAEADKADKTAQVA